MENKLPPGYRFYPTEEELISFYLHNKLHSHKPDIDCVIPSIDIYNFDPWQLPEQSSKLNHKDREQWFFFMPQQKREARGGRPNRTTSNGYWKATGSPSIVYSSNNNKPIGVKKTMVFYKGKAPSGRKTKWKMNEYKAINTLDENNNNINNNNNNNNINNNSNNNINNNSNNNISNIDNNNNNNNNASSSTGPNFPKLRHELSLCRVYVTSGCARAFDRRPPATPPPTTTTTTTTTTMLLNNNVHAPQNDYTIILDNNNNNKQNEESQRCGTQSIQNSMNNSEGNTSSKTCDIEMTESLDNFWDQLELAGNNLFLNRS